MEVQNHMDHWLRIKAASKLSFVFGYYSGHHSAVYPVISQVHQHIHFLPAYSGQNVK